MGGSPSQQRFRRKRVIYSGRFLADQEPFQSPHGCAIGAVFRIKQSIPEHRPESAGTLEREAQVAHADPVKCRVSIFCSRRFPLHLVP